MISTQEKLNSYLDRALNIIISLEEYASEETAMDIEALFQEIKYSDYIDADMEVWKEYSDDVDADMESQDYDIFVKHKI